MPIPPPFKMPAPFPRAEVRPTGAAARLTPVETDATTSPIQARAQPRPPRSNAGTAGRRAFEANPHDALLVVDVETVPDTDLIPADWDADRFPKSAWHRIVAVSVVEIALEHEEDGGETYAIRSCRSGGEPGWSEERLIRSFWRMFKEGHFRLVTWNGRSFDVPTLLLRSMRHGIAVPTWFRRGSKFASYGHRYSVDWHADLMEAMCDFGATARLTLDEAAALVGAPGKLGESGAMVADLISAGQIDRVRDYCETDVLNLTIIYARWAYLTGRTNASGHDALVGGVITFLEKEGAKRPHLSKFLDAWRRRWSERPPFVSRQTAIV